MITASASQLDWRKYLLNLSLPVMLSNAMIPIVGMVDTAVMGRMGSPEWIAATAVGALLFSSIYWLFGFLRMGTGGLVAQAFGAGDNTEAGRVTVRALLIASALGLMLILLQKPILSLGLAALADAQDWKTLTRQYFSVRILAAPASLMLFVIMGTLIGLQQMRRLLLLQGTLTLLNVTLTIALFNMSDLHIVGVAIATLTSEYLTLALGLWLLRPIIRNALRQGSVRDWLMDSTACLRFFRISGDLFIRTLCLIAAVYWMTVLGSRLGVAVLAVNSVLMHLVSLTAYCLDGFAHAIETLTGYAIGKGNNALFRQACRTTVELALVSAVAFAILFWLAGDVMIGLLTTDPQVLSLVKVWLPWLVILPLSSVWSFLLDGIFIGATQTSSMRNSMLLSLLVFGLTSALLVPLIGNHGIWLSYHVLFLARAVTLGRYYPEVLQQIRQPAQA